jgi:hypothetical protein
MGDPVTKAEKEFAIREALRYAYDALMADCKVLLGGKTASIKIRLVMPDKTILEISSNPNHPELYLP